MAGDWIPMRTDLHEDPAVIAIANAVGLDECGVVGRLHRLWSWANKQLADGNAVSVTDSWVDRYVSTPGFAAAMVGVGWLNTSTSGIAFPNFERWNSQGAKKRALTARRVAIHKLAGNAKGNAGGNAKGNAPSVTKSVPTEQNSTEEDIKTPLPPAKPGGGGGPAAEAFDPVAAEEAVEAAAQAIEPWSELVKEWKAARLPGWDKAIQRTSDRVGWWQVRLRDPAWRAGWREAVRRAGESPALRGEDPTFFVGGLRINTFLEKPSFVARINEGEFDRKPLAGTTPADKRSADLAAVIAAAKRKAG